MKCEWTIDFWNNLRQGEIMFKITDDIIKEIVNDIQGDLEYAKKMIRRAKRIGHLKQVDKDLYTIGKTYLETKDRYWYSKEVKNYYKQKKLKKTYGLFYKFIKEK